MPLFDEAFHCSDSLVGNVVGTFCLRVHRIVYTSVNVYNNMLVKVACSRLTSLCRVAVQCTLQLNTYIFFGPKARSRVELMRYLGSGNTSARQAKSGLGKRR